MQAGLLPFVQATQHSGTDLKGFCGKLNSDENGFDNILKGIIGAATQNNFPAATNASLNKTTTGQTQQFQAVQAASQDLSMLQNIVQKLAAALQEQKIPAEAAELNELLKNILTDEELSFIQQFLQNTSLSAALQNSGSSDLMTTAGLAAESNSPAQQQLMPLLAALISAVSGIIDKQGPAAPATSDAMLSQEITGQNVLVQDGSPQDQSRNPLQLLMALRDKLQQLYTAGIKVSASGLSQVKGAIPLQNAGQQGLEQPPVQPQQALTQTMAGGPGQTAQPGLQQGDAGGQQGTETAQSGKQIFQNLSALTENNQQQQQNQNSFSERMPAFAGKSGQQSNDMPLALLFSQSQSGKNLMTSAQGLNGQSIEQLLGNAQLWNKLAAVPQAAVQIDAGIQQTQLQQMQPKNAGTDKTPDRPVLLRELLASGDTQQTLTRFELTAGTDKVFAKTPVNASYLIDQIISRINAAARQGGQKISLQLYPPSLGKLHIELAMKDNQLRAVVIAESAQVKQMLDASIDQLRTGLESQNIQVDKLSVVVAGGGGGEFERSASYLRDHSGKGKKNAGGRDTLEQVDETMPDPAAPFWSRQGIINADAVDIFA